MSETEKKKKSKDKDEKKFKKKSLVDSTDNGVSEQNTTTAKTTLSLLADDARIDPTLSSLFAANPTPPVRKTQVSARTFDDVPDDADNGATIPERDESRRFQKVNQSNEESVAPQPNFDVKDNLKRKRRRKDAEDDLEDVYMRRLEYEDAKEAELAASERAKKRKKASSTSNGYAEGEKSADAEHNKVVNHELAVQPDHEPLEDDMSPPPLHETEQAPDIELAKANRTVFLGNVSTTAIASKAARKVLTDHMKSFFEEVLKSKTTETKHKVESIRFRSTPYAVAAPKKASFARKEVMDATAKSTNAYVVYSSQLLAREAVKHLNGTIVLDRHLRVDSVAHPAPVDHKRCVFVGGLSFVDDESNIQSANEEQGKEKRKRPKQPADVEEGLWRSFGKCGNVESVRVIRDSATRVGKGFAYVQFEDVNAVEAALLYDGKKFPPTLPRTLRVSRAKAVKRNKTSGSQRPSMSASGNQRNVSNNEASKMGRTKKLLGRAAATSQVRKLGREERRPRDPNREPIANGVKRPESFVFEGHRATSKGGKSGLKLGKKKKGGKPTDRSAKYKATKKK